MLVTNIKCKYLYIITLLFPLFNSYAGDVIKTVTPISGGGKSSAYKQEVILRALELSQGSHGDFTIKNTAINMKPLRAIRSIKEGELINVAIIAANKEWDDNTLVIKIPIRGGTLSYRLLLINKVNESKFSKIESLSDLEELTVGLQNDWSTTPIFENSLLPTMKSQNFEGIFLMLNSQRVDYIPRAIYEVFNELNMRKSALENVMVAPDIALYIPMVTYIYVSPKHPRIAERLSLGLKELVKTGELRAIFDKYYAQDIEKSNLNTRTVIELENPYFKGNFNRQQQSIWTLHNESISNNSESKH